MYVRGVSLKTKAADWPPLSLLSFLSSFSVTALSNQSVESDGCNDLIRSGSIYNFGMLLYCSCVNILLITEYRNTRVRNFIFVTVAIGLAFCALLASKTDFNFEPESEGLFLLYGEFGQWFELTDDLVPEDAERFIWGMPLYPFRKHVESAKCVDPSASCIDFKWDKSRGRGFIRNTWPDGRKLIINLGRFKDSVGRKPSGLFIGGGLPPTDPDYQITNKEAAGMAYFDGQRWFHIWCNANEALIPPSSPVQVSYPSEWKFKGSWVRENNGRDLTIQSRHSAIFTGVPIDIDRVLFYTAGNSYVILSVTITNRGTGPLTFKYLYGDEPWIGDFGSSAGDVGWMDRELVLTEKNLDTKKQTYFGMVDYGNELAGEIHQYTGYANFLEWDRHSRPSKAYIANLGIGDIKPGNGVPLASPDNRFIGLQYGPNTLNHDESFTFTIAVGMAGRDSKTGFPVKPTTGLNP